MNISYFQLSAYFYLFWEFPQEQHKYKVDAIEIPQQWDSQKIGKMENYDEEILCSASIIL